MKDWSNPFEGSDIEADENGCTLTDTDNSGGEGLNTECTRILCMLIFLFRWIAYYRDN